MPRASTPRATTAARSTATRSGAARSGAAGQPEAAAPGGREERPLGELLSDVTAQLQQLVRKEMELARVETKEQIGRAGKGAAAFGGAAFAGLLAAILVAFAAAFGLAEVMATGLAFLIVGVVVGAVAGILALQGKKKMASVDPVPQQTVETVKEDVETAKDSLQRGVQPPNYSDAWGR